ncbi:hypothetical protein TREMEDRAFT_43454 [Tremella mesenterica DSM 1558]|uniref:uncharacterized protein n=1 Tax=Tremella mesenterica (strain ATCC 24925 / CBS 8224 / DSM 1558 / NBRC 9311 / NRRL Y-6157 / RJB 2259-6 / UBC 559-6) TaxID=578456 RepID=UPI0003F49710|nr:uncharacterized protein TREMEDRAFT_43454 [Tremella mesenterica DSM 1558]EIW70923.1 hypothetical protein TREMEDRAFT_43454 [Tremella mesenterica DSM 1558]
MSLKSILKPTQGQGNKRSYVPKTGSKLRQSIVLSPESSKSTRVKRQGEGRKVVSKNVGRVPRDDDKDDVDGDESEQDEEDVEMSGEEGTDDDDMEKVGSIVEKIAPKRKQPTTSEQFGTTLASLLTESSRPPKKFKKHLSSPATSSADTSSSSTKQSSQPLVIPAKETIQPGRNILSLSRAPLPPSKAAEALERKATRQLKKEKAEKIDAARVRDVLEGWNAADGTGAQEFEKGLKKVAQRGVIKLFNAILVASKNAESTPTPQSLAEQVGVKDTKKRKEKDNVLGRGGKEGQLTSERFLDLVRNG